MAAITWTLGIAAKIEAVPGTAEVFATGGALTLADGIVLGDAGSGIGESGVDFALERIDKAVAPVTGSYTTQFPTFLRRELAKLTVTIHGKGSGATSTAGTTVDADFDQATDYPGLDALLAAAGLNGGAWGSGVGWAYVPAATQSITVKVWVGSGADAVLYILYNCTAKLSISCPPGDISLWTFEIEGSVSSHSTVSLPTFAYGTVATVSAPTVESTVHSFGIGAAARGFSEMEITIDNQIEDVPDSNAVGGITKRQTGREITAAATIYADSADEDYEDTNLAATAATTDDLVFVIGAATAPAAAAVSWRVNFLNPVVRSNEPAQLGPSVARTVELLATGTTANSEFELIFY